MIPSDSLLERLSAVRPYKPASDAGGVEEWGLIDLPIGKDENRKFGEIVSLRKMKVDFDLGRNSRTLWRPVREARGPPGERTVMHLKPETGRSHQLRVHMKELGHTIGESSRHVHASASCPLGEGLLLSSRPSPPLIDCFASCELIVWISVGVTSPSPGTLIVPLERTSSINCCNTSVQFPAGQKSSGTEGKTN